MEDGDYRRGLPAGRKGGAGPGGGGSTGVTACGCCPESSKPRPRRWTAAMERTRARRLPVLWEDEIIGEVERRPSPLARKSCSWPATETRRLSATANPKEPAGRPAGAPTETWAWLSAPKAVDDGHDVGRLKAYRNWLPPLGLTTWRLYAALAISIIPSCSWLTITTPRATSDAYSSLPILVSHLHAEGPLGHVLRLIPTSLASRFSSLPLLAQLSTPLTTESFTTQAWPLAKASLLRRGYPHALGICLLAILTHHIRRTLVPWLGQGLYRQPLTHIKLAVGAPLPFIDTALSMTWSHALFTLLQEAVFDYAGGAALSILVADAQLHSNRELPPGSNEAYSRAALDTAQIFYIAWLLSGLENFHTQTSLAASFAMAYPRLIPPLAPRSYSSALLRTLRSHIHVLPLHAWFMYDTTSTLIALLRGALGAALVRHAGLLVALVGAVVGTGYVVRFSNKLYMVLEMGGLVMALALCFGACAVLGREALGDYLQAWCGFVDGQALGVGVPGRLKPSFMARG